jgi:hypothetical protein
VAVGSSSRLHGVPAKNRQEIDKSAAQRIRRAAKLLLELVELMGLELMTS